MSSLNSLSFHWRNALFAFRESWTHLANSIVGFLLFPVFMFILAHMWQKFNGHLGNYTYKEMLAYIWVTEILFMTFLRPGNVSQASGDFSPKSCKASFVASDAVFCIVWENFGLTVGDDSFIFRFVIIVRIGLA